MNRNRNPQADFDRIARAYRWLEYITLGGSLQSCRTHFLSQLAARRHALILGDGDGRFTAALLRAHPETDVVAVDTSATMLHILTRRCGAIVRGRAACLSAVQQNVLEYTPSKTTDLVVAHFFFDCFTRQDLELLTSRVGASVAPHTLWLVSDFRIPGGLMHWPARALTRALYFAFRILTGLRTSVLPDHAAVLSALGLTCIARHNSLAGLLTTELWLRKEYTLGMLPEQRSRTGHPPDPVPDPEPASPSLPEPDPEIYHHEPEKPSKPED